MSTHARHGSGSDEQEHYDERTIAFLEALWGGGYLSPGGPAEVDRMLDGLDLRGARVLDVGCGSGGITVALARDHGAAAVLGIDVEGPVCAHARRRVAAAGLTDRVEIHHDGIINLIPGIPLIDASTQIVPAARIAANNPSHVEVMPGECLSDFYRYQRTGELPE